MSRPGRRGAGTSRRAAAATALAALTLVSGACGSDSDGDGAGTGTEAPAPEAGGTTLTIKDFAFSPQPLVVPVGTRVTVTNSDDAAHTATADDKSFDTGNLAKGQTKEITLSKAGEVPYFCAIHDYMRGVIRVGQ